MWQNVSTKYKVTLRPLEHIKSKLQFKVLFWVKISQAYCHVIRIIKIKQNVLKI